MKILLTTLNSKYIHTGLALRYLYSYCKEDFNMTIEEYTINHHMDYILGEIYKGEFDIVCFSCYIWNISSTLAIVRNLKKVRPELTIVLGGPEVSFDAVSLMEKERAIDHIIVGEGEETFKELMNLLVNNKGKLKEIKGITYRENSQVFKTIDRELIKDLGTIPPIYTANLEEYKNKIIYYESSRGCPHNCRYCLSSTIKGVRFFPLDQVKRDLGLFLEKRVKQVKFVDRTFNVKKSHSLEIMKYIVEHDNGYTNFHFEITADLLDDEMLTFLSNVREGLFQFEIGVQTTYDPTMKSIDRKVDFHILSKVVRKIGSFRNIHLHLDLIAGLPFEDFKRFKKSFDDVYDLKPEKLQLGFLKLLKGSGIRKDKDLHEYVFKNEPPYEVLENKYMSYKDVLKLKMIEEMVELFYNGDGFQHGINYVIENFYDNPSDFYHQLADFWEDKGYHHVSHGKNKYYEILLTFYKERNWKNEDVFREILKFDYLMQGKTSLPKLFVYTEEKDFQKRRHEFLHEEKNLEKYLSKYKNMAAKEIIKKVHFEKFKYDVLDLIKNPKLEKVENEITVLFDYDLEQKVFTKAKYHKVDI
ncbi:B12-binding domain-containing radical SAM protein [Crassaminicella profunda]|uniref:B12-binding domain-containing radical SAM protein n=1 Tax=Crassaminicella profunda TaxID=1286698 RepID=UPI001CA6758E|nr:B12-binding domain-containing radical SAM protein [Crassaminicella profunda]QZY56343.1 B12-binding domain-containing radical SAM protein [Crassaminicella profunda]